MSEPLRAAVIGAGYWGPNLARNFRGSPDWDLVAVCDLDESRARKVVGDRSTVEVMTSVDALLARDDVDAVAIATPAGTHARLALAALDAGKHVVVEKPIAVDEHRRAADGRARRRGRPGPHGRPHVLLHLRVLRIREHDRRGRARGPPLRGLGTDQPRPGPARRRRVLGPRARTTCRSSTSSCRVVCSPSGSPPRAPTRSARASPASGTSPSRCPAARSPTCT